MDVLLADVGPAPCAAADGAALPISNVHGVKPPTLSLRRHLRITSKATLGGSPPFRFEDDEEEEEEEEEDAEALSLVTWYSSTISNCSGSLGHRELRRSTPF